MNKERILTAIIVGAVVVLLLLVLVFMRPTTGSPENPPATAISVPSATVVPPAATAIPPTPTPEESNDAAIQNIVWQWTQTTDQSSGAVTVVPNPASYTIIFRADETFTGTADCNQISGTYSTRSGFSISVRTTTSAYCGESSLDQVYITTLGNVVAGGLDGAGGLALETGGGAQRMQFSNGGLAP